MLDSIDFYPPAPADVPPDLAKPSPGYRVRVVIVLVSLVTFVVLYVGLVVGSAYLAYYAFTPNHSPYGYGGYRTSKEWSHAIMGWMIVGASSSVLCLFLVKGFFKRQRAGAALQIEITAQDQPALFAFIEQVCKDCRAPFPRHVYLCPDVNACVFYNPSLLSLVMPTGKNLVLGLGLVNRLNLSEIKAVLAHEFGHFSQSSMKLGTYVYTSNRIIGEIVFGRDWLDDVIGQLKRVDARIAMFVSAFLGVLWLVRKTLQGLFNAINFANSALSRQMEFNADLVAARVTGSDALVHALSRLEFANEALMFAVRDLTSASDHEIFSRDLFFHQNRSAIYLRMVRKDLKLGEPPPLPDDPSRSEPVFQKGDLRVPLMWATHPTNFDREQNLKRQYMRSVIDNRSAWLLFQDGQAVREKITRKYYTLMRPGEHLTLADPEVVQAFIDDEHLEMTYDPRYHGLFDNRFITPGKIQELITEATFAPTDANALAEAHAALLGDDLKTRVESYKSRQAELNLLAGLVDGSLKLAGKHLMFRETQHRPREARRLLEQVKQEITADNAWMSNRDRQCFRVHYEMAQHAGENGRCELADRYHFHLAVQEILGEFLEWHHHVQLLLSQVAGQRELHQDTYRQLRAGLQGAQDCINRNIDRAASLRLPTMKNMTAGEQLNQFLTPRVTASQLTGHEQNIDGQWINQLLQQYAEVLDKARRIHYKSLGGILALQERIAAEWASSQSLPAAVSTPEASQTSAGG